MSLTRRKTISATYALTTSSATTPDVDISNAASGEIQIPTGSTITTLTYYTKASTADTPLPAQDSTGAAITQTVAATKSYPIPAGVMGAGILRIVANAAGNVQIALKS